MPWLDHALERAWIDAQRCRGVAHQQKVESFAETATGLEQRLDSQIVVDATVPEFISLQGRRRRHEFAALVAIPSVAARPNDQRAKKPRYRRRRCDGVRNRYVRFDHVVREVRSAELPPVVTGRRSGRRTLAACNVAHYSES